MTRPYPTAPVNTNVRRLKLLRLIPLCLVLAGCSHNIVKSYPQGWNTRPAMSANCSEVFGYYKEANPKESGNNVPSFWALSLNKGWHQLRIEDPSVLPRQMRISYDNQDIDISYFINELPVFKKTILVADYSCSKDGLRITLYKRYGAVYDIFPNYGSIVITATLLRDNEYLYVKTTSKSSSLMFYLFPSWGTNESWYRFPVLSNSPSTNP